MDFEPTPEQKAFFEKARRFAEEVIKPKAADAMALHSAEILRQLGNLEMMGVAAPREDGGCGRDHVSYVLALMEIAKACASTGAAMFVNNSLYGHPLLVFGKKEQKARYLRSCAAGEGIGSVPLEHPFSDPNAVRMSAVRAGGGWAMSGRQILIGNGISSTHCLLPAITQDDAGTKEVSLFVLDLGNTPGARLSEGEDLPAEEAAVLTLDQAGLPRDSLLGVEGKGLDYLLKARPVSWIGLAAYSVGLGRAVLGRSLDYSRGKKRFGKPVFSTQAVQWLLADMATDLDAAELLTLKAAWRADQKKTIEKEAAMAKVYASDAALKAAADGAQIMGEDIGVKHSGFEVIGRAKRCQIDQGNNLKIWGFIAGQLVRDLKGTM